MRISRLSISAAIVLCCFSGCQQESNRNPGKVAPAAVLSSQKDSQESYLSRRARFKTSLLKRGPSRQSWTTDTPPAGVKVVEYQSNGRKLSAWLFLPKIGVGQK